MRLILILVLGFMGLASTYVIVRASEYQTPPRPNAPTRYMGLPPSPNCQQFYGKNLPRGWSKCIGAEYK